jgi:hypothetical protein
VYGEEFILLLYHDIFSENQGMLLGSGTINGDAAVEHMPHSVTSESTTRNSLLYGPCC